MSAIHTEIRHSELIRDCYLITFEHLTSYPLSSPCEPVVRMTPEIIVRTAIRAIDPHFPEVIGRIGVEVHGDGSASLKLPEGPNFHVSLDHAFFDYTPEISGRVVIRANYRAHGTEGVSTGSETVTTHGDLAYVLLEAVRWAESL